MGQKNYKYVDVFGGIHLIAYYHGEESGHFILIIDNMISTIEFGIKESKTYSFYIGPELLQLRIVKVDEDTYDYEIEYGVQTTFPSTLEKIRDMVAFVIMVLLSVGMGCFLLYMGITALI